MLVKWFKHKGKTTSASRADGDEAARTLPLRQIPVAIVEEAIRRLPAKPTQPETRETTSAHVQGKGLVQLEFAWIAKSPSEGPRWHLVDARQARQDSFTSKAEFPPHVRDRLG